MHSQQNVKWTGMSETECVTIMNTSTYTHYTGKEMNLMD
jgi:hypothetical protein